MPFQHHSDTSTEADRTEKTIFQSPPPHRRPTSPAVMADSRRIAAIISTNSKWVNGTVLHYYFFTKRHFKVLAKQRAAFKKWKAVGIGLEFRRSPGRVKWR